MHSYPWVLVACNTKKGAKKACDKWIEEHIEGSPFDYGGSIEEDTEENGFKTVIPSNDPKFMEALKSAVEAERDALKEQWDIIKQFVLKFAACRNPPSDDSKVRIERAVAYGISGLIDSGKVVNHEQSAYLCYYSFHSFYELRRHIRDGRGDMITSNAAVFCAVDVEVDAILSGEYTELEGLFLVRTDFHS